MVFKAKDRNVFKMHITLPDGRGGVFSCGTSDEPTAKHVAAMVKTLKRRRQFAGLEAVVSKKITLAMLFDAYEGGYVDTLLKELSDPDLSDLLDQWDGNPTYKKQIRRMISGRYPASRFTRKAVSEFLAGLTLTSHQKGRKPTTELASGSTRNRYRAALSVFARWLVERDVIEANPVREVRGAKPNPARMVWLEREQAKALLNALPAEMRAMGAIMAATGMELGAVKRLRRRDVDEKGGKAHAQGSKTLWRNRIVVSTEPWAWALVLEHVRNLAPNAPVFTTRGDRLLKEHRKASKELGLPATTLHDWRHSYAVWSLRDGLSPTVVARQLGHKDAHLVHSVYGRFIPDERDFQKTKVTRSATRPHLKVSGKGR